MSPKALINSQNKTSYPEKAIASAIDQSTTVLMKRKMKTERGVAVSDAGCSSVVGMTVHNLEGCRAVQDRQLHCRG